MARKSSLTDQQQASLAARIAAGDGTYESVARELKRDPAGLKRLLQPLVVKLSDRAADAGQKIHDAVNSIHALPAPLKKSSVGLLSTLLATLDNDFAGYVANSAKLSLHASKLALNRFAKAGANPSPEDLAHVSILTKIGKESASPILESARIMGDAAAKGSSPEKPRRIVITARK